MKQQVRRPHFFKRALEGFNEGMGNLVDKTHCIHHHHLVSVRQLETANGGVEGSKELILDHDPGPGERIHERRFSRVGISHQRDSGVRHRGALPALQGARALHRRQATSQGSNPLAHPPSVHFQLGLAGPPSPDSPPEARKMRPTASQAGQQIAQLRQLDLKLSFVAPGALGKDVENQLAPIDNADLESGLEIALLRRAKILIKDHQVRLETQEALADLLHLPASDQSRRASPLQVLSEYADHERPGAPGQLCEFLHAPLHRDPAICRRDLDTDQDGLLADARMDRVDSLQESKLAKVTRSPKRRSTASLNARPEATLRWMGSSITVSACSGSRR